MTWVMELQPVGLRIPLAPGENLLTALRKVLSAGSEQIYAPCGGRGTCGQCRVKVCHGPVSPPNQIELDRFTPEELASGYRLACQTQPLGSLKVEVPPESIVRGQKLQIDGASVALRFSPLVVTRTIALQATSMDCPLSTWEQVRETLAAKGNGQPAAVGLELIRTKPARATAGKVHLVMREGTVIDVRFDDPPFKPLGLAVDLGTTKIAAYLIDLESGALLASEGEMNPQIPYGEDVMSRLAYALSGPDTLERMGAAAAEGIDRLLGKLVARAGRVREEVYEVVVAGNTAMHHLLLRLPVGQLGRAPYVPAIGGPLSCPTREIGIRGAPQALVHLLPAVSGFIGGDHLAMIVGAGIHQAEGTVLGLDIGTNTEIVLADRGRMVSCSCASGPAFEGAHIHQGMRAVEGAICRFRLHRGGAEIEYETIGNVPPRGFCGSGILDGIAELVRLGIVNAAGRLDKDHPRVRCRGDSGAAFLLVPGSESGTGHDIIITQKDISEIQLAKGAVAAGVEMLSKECAVDLDMIEKVVVAGAFGTHLRLESAIRVGLLPDLPGERFVQVGNASGTGARGVLLSTVMRQEVVDLGRRLQCLELTRRKEFSRVFARAVRFPMH